MPLLEGVKRMTECPRNIERLRSEKDIYQAWLAMVDRAMVSIGQTQAKTDAEAVQEVIKSLEQDWRRPRADIASRLQLIETQLGRLLAPEDEGAGVTEIVRKFLTGRGLNILLAAGTFVIIYVLLAGPGGAARR